MRALVISGGGSKGAFAGGLAEHLILVQKREYKLFIGSSTGSLLVPLLAIGEIEKLKAVFTSVTQSDIFNTCPFIIKKSNGIYKTSINHWGILKMFIKGRKTFGESENLRKLIINTITETDFTRIQNLQHEVVVAVSNLSTMSVEYKDSKECSYRDFCDWIWASTSLVPFMSLVIKDDSEYADGGMGDIVPIQYAIQKGATEIDVIILRNKGDLKHKYPARNALDLTGRIFDFMLKQIANNDLTIGRLEGQNRKVKLNFYNPPEDLTSNSLIFDPELMKRWWNYGYEVGQMNNPKSKII
jgi:NTE family protein